MRVLIAGGGRTASHLATVLLGAEHEVRVIENRPEVLFRLHREIPTEAICEGDPLDPAVFEHAGARQANVLAACTASDADNLMLCYAARFEYHVPRTIAVINIPRSAWLFDRKFGVDVALNQAEILAGLIQEEMSLGDMMVLTKLHRGKFTLVEEKIPSGSPIVGLTVRDSGLPPNSVIAAVFRHGKIVIPRGDLAFEVGDELLALVDPPAAEELARLFSRSRPADTDPPVA